MTHPKIHMNGTGRDTLTREYTAAYEAVLAAQTALAGVTVHGRDYYTISPEAVNSALEEHRARRAALATVADDLLEILMGLQEK